MGDKLKIYIFAILFLFYVGLIAKECKSESECSVNQYCTNSHCIRKGNDYSVNLESEMEYFISNNRQFEMSILLDFSLNHYLSDTNDWESIYFSTRIGINQKFNKLSIAQFELGRYYEIYFFDIRIIPGIGSGVLLSNIDKMDFLIYLRGKIGLFYSLTHIWKPLKIGTETSFAGAISILPKSKNRFSLLLFSTFVIKFGF